MNQKTLIMGAGAVGILGLLWASSAARGQDDGIVGGGGGGGGYSVPFVDADKGAEKTEGGGTTSFQISFPDVTIPSLPQPTSGFSDSGHSTPTGAIPTEVTYSSGKKETIYITAPPPGISSTTVGRPAGPLSQEEKDFMGGGGGFGGGGAGGRGDTSKKDDTLSGTNPISDFIGGIGNAIGGFFGW